MSYVSCCVRSEAYYVQPNTVRTNMVRFITHNSEVGASVIPAVAPGIGQYVDIRAYWGGAKRQEAYIVRSDYDEIQFVKLQTPILI